MIMEVNPHLLVEGTIISSYATKVHHAFIYIRGELPYADPPGGARGRKRPMPPGYIGKNILGSGFDLRDHRRIAARAPTSAAKRARCWSRWRASAATHASSRRSRRSSASMAARRSSTTSRPIATVPAIVQLGADVYAAYGTEKSKGTRIYCLSGHVNRPGNYELPLGTPLRALIEEFGGGVRGGKQIKAIIPGGSSTPLL